LGAVLAEIHFGAPGSDLRAHRDDEPRAHARERARGLGALARRSGAAAHARVPAKPVAARGGALRFSDMERIAGLFVALALLSAFFWLVESLFAANPEQPRGPARRGFGTDVAYWFATPLLTKSVSQIGLAIILVLVYRASPAEIREMLLARDTGLAAQPLALQAVEMLVVGDLLAYWLHRAFHVRPLWRFHAVHHSSTHLDWLSSVRLHPVNDWLTRWVQAS